MMPLCISQREKKKGKNVKKIEEEKNREFVLVIHLIHRMHRQMDDDRPQAFFCDYISN